MELERRGNYQEALALYQSVIAKDPTAAEARQAQLRMAKLYQVNLNQPERAVEIYRQIVSSAPRSEEALTARYELALYHFRNEEYPEAARLFEEIVNLAPTTDRGADAQVMLAKTYEKMGKLEEAAETYAAFSNLHADRAEAAALALETRARLLEQMGRKAEAIEARQRIVRDFGAEITEKPEVAQLVETAKEELQAAGAEVPAPRTYETMSRGEQIQVRRQQLRERDRPESAKQAAQQRAASNIFGVSADDLVNQYQIVVDEQGTMYDAMFILAQSMQQMGDYRAAGALYQRAIELAEADEDRKGPWENLGAAYKGLFDVYQKLGLRQLAKESLERALQRNPKVLDQVIDSGLYDYANGDYEQAIETWSSILGLNEKKDSELWYNIGLAYKKLGNTAKEVEAFERSLAADPDNLDAAQSLAEALYYRAGKRQRSYIFQDIADEKAGAEGHWELGMLAFKYGYYRNAEAEFRIGARLAERDEATAPLAARMKAFELVARVKRDRSQVEAIEPELQALAQAHPEDGLVQYAYALFLVEKGSPDEAIALLKAVMERRPNDPEPARALVNLYLSRGQLDQAVAVLDAYAEKNPRDQAMLLWRDQLRLQLNAESVQNP